jgi:hypothetical protein
MSKFKHLYFNGQILSNLFFSVGKNSGSFGFSAVAFVLAKPNVPECAVGFSA